MMDIETINALSALVQKRDSFRRALKNLREIETSSKFSAQRVEVSIWVENNHDFSGSSRCLSSFDIDEFKDVLELSVETVEGKLTAKGVKV